jgi:hypothetical protein
VNQRLVSSGHAGDKKPPGCIVGGGDSSPWNNGADAKSSRRQCQYLTAQQPFVVGCTIIAGAVRAVKL